MIAAIAAHLCVEEGNPASVVALTSAARLALSGSKITVAVFLPRSIFVSATPGTFPNAFLTANQPAIFAEVSSQDSTARSFRTAPSNGSRSRRVRQHRTEHDAVRTEPPLLLKRLEQRGEEMLAPCKLAVKAMSLCRVGIT